VRTAQGSPGKSHDCPRSARCSPRGRHVTGRTGRGELQAAPVQAGQRPALTQQMPRADPRTRHRPRGFSWPPSKSPNTMLSFFMEPLGFAFRGHFSQFLKHAKVGGLGISSWFLYITDGASITQHLPLGKREQCRWEEPFLGRLDSLWLPFSSEPWALWGAWHMQGGTTVSQTLSPLWVCPPLPGP